MTIQNYRLPHLMMVAGSTKTFTFNLKTVAGASYDADDCTARIALIHYENREASPVLTKTLSIQDDDNGIASTAILSLGASDTKNLSGRYIYQISISNGAGSYCIPGKGTMDILKNIDKSFIQ